MKVLVFDTSVLIDLERASLLEPTFRLPFEFTVPDLLYERELREYGGAGLIRLGLRVEELDADAVALALGYREKRRSLSLPDSFALALARTNSWTLLSGDRVLRELAAEEKVACHGVLWLFDQVFEHCIIDTHTLCAGLRELATHPRCRLPKAKIAQADSQLFQHLIPRLADLPFTNSSASFITVPFG